MDRREFVKAAFAVAGTLGLSQAVKLGTAAEKTLVAEMVARGNPSDVQILEGALTAEYKAIYAYTAALDSGLLKTKAKELSTLFRASHQGHSDILTGAIKSLGGTPQAAEKKYDLGVKLASPADIARYAYSLERGAAQAYMNAVGLLHNDKLKDATAMIMADEVLHATTWYEVLGHHPMATGFNQLPDKL